MELLSRIAGAGVCSYTDVDRQRTTVSVFLRSREDWSPQMASELNAGLKRLGGFGLNAGLARVLFRQLRPEDWRESWKRHFKTVAIGTSLLVKPSWSRRKPRKGQAVVVLDPGLSFGTGHHPTTAFCLRALTTLRRQFSQRSLLDVGTGSGILAIAAVKLGYHPVCALDSDPDAVRCAQANARTNKVRRRVRLVCRELGALPCHTDERFSVICANLNTRLLLDHRDRLVSRLAPGGALVLAGCLTNEFALVQRSFEGTGLKLSRARADGEWRAGVFRRV